MYVLDLLRNKTRIGDVVVSGTGLRFMNIILPNLNVYLVTGISKKGRISVINPNGMYKKTRLTAMSFVKIDETKLEEDELNKILKFKEEFSKNKK